MRLALGSVQFGLDYGISNRSGRVGDAELAAILALARRLGIDTLDTAQAYGDAEQRLGEQALGGFALIGKLAPGIQTAEVAGALTLSLRRLKRQRLEGLLLHRSQDASPALLEQLSALQRQGRVGKIGVSVYSPDELASWLAQGYPLQLVQLPANLLDQRFLRAGWLDKLQALGCEIHVRSLFLQGLLLMQPAQRPVHFRPFEHALTRLDGWRPDLSPLAKALSLINALPQVHRFVVGICHAHELAAIATACLALTPCDDAELAELAASEPALINPSLWRRE